MSHENEQPAQLFDIRRKFEIDLISRLLKPFNFIQVLVGPRQVGKTTALTRIFDEWKGAKHMVSADSPTPPDPEWIRVHWETA